MSDMLFSLSLSPEGVFFQSKRQAKSISDTLPRLVPQRMYGRGNSSTPADKVGGGKDIHRHDRGTSQQAPKLNDLSNLTPGHRNDGHGSGLVIHYSDCHLVGDDRGDRFRRG